jgi:V/A-type H+-transporting ATPase subunit C
MAKYKDTNYLGISARIRAMETQLLTQARMERMLEAKTDDEAAKVLSECGYNGLEPLTEETLTQSLTQQRNDVFADLYAHSPNPALVDVFRIKYDYHNAKTILKAAATGQDATRLFIDAGRIEARKLQEAVLTGSYSGVPDRLRRAIQEANEVLGATQDPQLADFTLDRAYYAEMLEAAKTAGSSFLEGYARCVIDAANLRSAVRTVRMGKSAEFLGNVLVPGGDVSTQTIQTAVFGGGTLEAAFAGSRLEDAAVLGASASRGGRQTAFEKACDDAVTVYLRSGRLTPFGDSVLVAYLAAKETEITAARIILSGRMAGVPAESIRERLREAYV